MVLTPASLSVLIAGVEHAVSLDVESMDHKLLQVLAIEVHQKLLPKFAYPKNKNVVTLSAAQALGLYILFKDIDFIDPFQNAVMRPIINEIHKMYI